MAWGTIVGAALGFAASIIPEIVVAVKDHYSQPAQPTVVINGTMEQAQIDATQTSQINDLTNIALDHEHFSVLRASVRPILTYAFFILFVVVIVSSLIHAFYVEHLSVVQALPVLWDDETETLFSAVVSFWFGSRSMEKAKSNATVEVTGTNKVVTG